VVTEKSKLQNLQKPIRILVVEDQAAVRSGLRYTMLAFDDLELVGEATSREEVLTLCVHAQPDVVLMDLLVPGIDAIETTRAIRQRHPRIKIVALTRLGAENSAQEMIKAGASGSVLKKVSADELVNAIRAVHRNHTHSAVQPDDHRPGVT
jgi:NarL family two-component system response regulator LiaR